MSRVRFLLGCILPFLGVVVFSSGCGSSKNPDAPAHISGLVTYNAKPVKGGTLTFHTDKGAYNTDIDADGTYAIADVPVGEVVATIDNEHLNPKRAPETGKALASKYGNMPTYQKPDAGATSAREYVKLPAIYANPKSSTLRVTISAGKQTKNLELKD
jgi:hypothetical protein